MSSAARIKSARIKKIVQHAVVEVEHDGVFYEVYIWDAEMDSLDEASTGVYISGLPSGDQFGSMFANPGTYPSSVEVLAKQELSRHVTERG